MKIAGSSCFPNSCSYAASCQLAAHSEQSDLLQVVGPELVERFDAALSLMENGFVSLGNNFRGRGSDRRPSWFWRGRRTFRRSRQVVPRRGSRCAGTWLLLRSRP